MSYVPPDDASERALRALAREAAEQPVPDLDWERVEKRLMASLQHAPDTLQGTVDRRPHPRLGVSSSWAIALAAAAAIVVVGAAQLRRGATRRPEVTALGSPEIRRPAAPELGTGEALAKAGPTSQAGTGDVVRLGDVVESDAQERELHYAGIVDLVLAPRSRIEMVGLDIVDGSQAITVALASGSVHAEVVPHPPGEVFAVEVEGTRVAVHGTSFTVTRDVDRVAVEVTHGSVVVGPTGHRGATQGFLLSGPGSGSFSLQGGVVASPVHPVPAKGNRPAAPMVSAPAIAGARDTSSASPNNAVGTLELPSSGELEAPARIAAEQAATRSILAGVEACYERQVSSSGITFTVESSLTLTILPTGIVREGLFNPPLSPTLLNCARDAVVSARFPRANTVRRIEVPVRLSRP